MQRVSVGFEFQNVLKARPARLEVVLWEIVCPLLTILEAAADVGKRERDANGSKFAKASNSAMAVSERTAKSKCKLVSEVDVNMFIMVIQNKWRWRGYSTASADTDNDVPAIIACGQAHLAWPPG